MKALESRLAWLLLVTVLLAMIFLVHFSKEGNPRTAGAAPRAQSPTTTIFLPLISRNFPIETVFGVEMFQITGAGGLTQVVAANTTWVRRYALIWSAVEPTEGTRNWDAAASLENEMVATASSGMQMILIVHSTPSWAQQVVGSACGPIRTDKVGAFASFMHDAVVRYSVSPYRVKYWEIWNEPDVDHSLVPGNNLFGCWGNQEDAYYGGGDYATALGAVHPQIKSADPQSQVLIGGLLMDCDPNNPPSGKSCLSSKFLEGVLREGGGLYFDGVSFHAYDYFGPGLGQYGNADWHSAWNTTGPVSIAKAGFIKQVLGNYGVTGKFLMNTEGALLCESCDTDTAFETTKAYYVAQSYASSIAHGLRANLWFSAVEGWRNSALLNDDLSARPAYTAFRFGRSELLNSSFAGDINSSDIGGSLGVKGYKLDRMDRRIWFLWSLDGNMHSVTLAGTPLAAWDTLGNSVAPAPVMNVGLGPLYLEWNP